MVCLHCGEPIDFRRGRGFVHVNGGGSYMMECPNCGWQGAPYPSPARCPNCGNIKIRDNHCAHPDYSKDE